MAPSRISHLLFATGWAQRMRGLIGRPEPPPGHALVLPGARQVHTFFMRYSIDVAFCDETGAVLDLVLALRPWRLTLRVRAAAFAVEMPAGGLNGAAPGDVIEGLGTSARSR